MSNQPSAAKGTADLAALAAVHDAVVALLAEEGLAVDEVRYCFHHPAGTDPELGRACDCRKPAPGLILQAADALGLDEAALGRSWLIGDSDVDVEAGRAAGLRTVLVEDPRSAHRRHGAEADARAGDVLEAARIVAAAARHHPRRGGTMTLDLSTMSTKIFADGADLESLLRLAEQPHIKGFTTNPTLMRKAGVSDYAAFAREVLAHITDRPISFEVFSDDADGMRRQAREIASWGPNVYVKIPVTNTRAEPMTALIRELSGDGVQLNVTALMTVRQVEEVAGALAGGAPSNISVFAGRVADTGRDPSR